MKMRLQLRDVKTNRFRTGYIATSGPTEHGVEEVFARCKGATRVRVDLLNKSYYAVYSLDE